MNKHILNSEVQAYISNNLQADVSKIALLKSPFGEVSSAALAGQIAAKKKSVHKLPSWYAQEGIYYPPLLSIEQCSSETTARYKSQLAQGHSLLDLTAGFGVDSFFFAQKIAQVYSCEINPELSAISAHNAQLLGANNIECMAVDGIEFLKNTNQQVDTIYLDPARRHQSNKVFKLKDCTPDVTQHLDFLLTKAQRVIIKTAPLLDITAGLAELKNVSEIHIVSVKNECKELLWVIDRDFKADPQVICATLNDEQKIFAFQLNELHKPIAVASHQPPIYLYEPDVALLKSGAFNLIGARFGLHKLHQHSQLYRSDRFLAEFPGRIFQIETWLTLNELKKERELSGNVIVRNFPEKPENLVKKYKIKSSHDHFIIFTQTNEGNWAIKAKILQHY
ncbi:hypothetical protein VRU48_05870 [Pedobacter sp. KR3-3]|uniref:THUMP-like domain-containing protein n=1 Tax=Pedobacter albus TaxID=3113905 RepID=A0ABU7I581_9SPHI|nr:hypothetical protein [Pedobacter sp. KR3-3]MEE1944625.1 hypothetical protein [Pedobacter sp. KR3-3]